MRQPLVLASPDPSRAARQEVRSLTSSTPDALWSSPALKALRPDVVTCTDLRLGPDLDGCSLSVPAGARLLIVSDPETTASTLLRVLAGLSRARQGEVHLAGSADSTSEGWGRRVAYLAPNPGLHAWMTPTEALHLAGRLLGLPQEEATRRVARAMDWTRIPAAAAGGPIRRGGLSLLQRTGLAAALVGDPEVLLLDEPLRAIDEHERSSLLKLPGQRRTIVMASRYPASEAGLVAHVAYLRRGRIELIAPVTALERAELPLSHRGIVALAELKAMGSPRPGAAPA